MNKDNSLFIYQDENGVTNISVLPLEEDMLLTQGRIAELYDATQPNISQHMSSIILDGELDDEATHK